MVLNFSESKQGAGSLGIQVCGLLLNHVENEVLGGKAPHTGSQHQRSLPPASTEELVGIVHTGGHKRR